MKMLLEALRGAVKHETSASERYELGVVAEGLAKAANLGALYNSYYRLLCRYTHGNLTAMTGFFSDIDIKESFLVGGGLSEIMLALKELGAACPNFCALNAEVSAICVSASGGFESPAAKTFDPKH
jgi:hypothetical protein